MGTDSKVQLFLLVNYFGGEQTTFYVLMLQSGVNKSESFFTSGLRECFGDDWQKTELANQYYRFSW